jgi:NHLM bacteriocin system ABC transporter peptidase/ATP-binding protein
VALVMRPFATSISAATRRVAQLRGLASRSARRVAPFMSSPETRPRGPAPGRVATPTILQMEAVECGAAALAIVLAHFGRYVPLEELRVACGVSRDGSKASNILRAARDYGLTAQGYKREPNHLDAMPRPMIVHWNFNHFVVLEGFSNRGAYLNDPARGPHHVTHDEFDTSFTGIALTFTPTAAFRAGGERRGLLPALRRRLRGSRSAVIFAILSGLALVVPGLVVPAFSRVFVDGVLVKGLLSWVTPLLYVMGATVLVRSALSWVQLSHLLRLETKFALKTSSEFFWHVMRLPVTFFAQRYAGEIGSRVAINDRIASLLAEELATTVLNIVLISFYAALMIRYDALLTGLGVATALVNLTIFRFVARRRKDLNQRLRRDQGALLGVAMSGLQSIETLKANGWESDFFAKWAGYQAKAVNGQQSLDLQTRSLSVVPQLLLAINTALLLGIGGLRIMSGSFSIGMLIAIQALMLSFLMPVNRLVDLASTLDEVGGDMHRLDDVLRAPLDPHAPDLGPAAGTAVGTVPFADAHAAGAARLIGHLELRNVSFGYSRFDPPRIDAFNLVLRPGSRVALIGASGCGKSTIARLVCGLYAPWTGEILLDGMPRQLVGRDALCASFAVVDQDIFLFEGTVRDNITLWDQTVDEADVTRAARDACIHDDITARPGGYSGSVDEGGRNFSGGQRQRLEIARALVSNPSLLVLDEATSALDPSTEAEIDSNLRRRGCTCLIIAHRLSTIRDCDEIILLDAGRIVQRGTHRGMRDVDGPYRSLVSAE